MFEFSETEKKVIKSNYDLFQKVITDVLYASQGSETDINDVRRFHLDCILESKDD